MECTKATPPARKVKKKQVKDEVDRIKQAEKKRRRLEKALAASAAIRSELEKKKQKKKEEQQRLDEEGAAIAEAVALHVLLGEDTDDPCKIMLKKDCMFSGWDCAGNIGFVMGTKSTGLSHQLQSRCSLEGFGWASNSCANVHGWNNMGNSYWSFSSDPSDRDDLNASYFEDGNWAASGISAGLIAAQAVSSLRIAEDAHGLYSL